MKRLLTAALLALSSSVFAATLNPITLLNPVGSTAGQAIVSTGPSTAPAWGNAAALAAQAANTVVANVTASSASPTAVPVPNCAGASSALTYTAGSGFSCNATINAVTLGGATFAAPGPIGSVSTSSGAFSSISTPSATIGGGTIDNTAIGATSASTGKFTTLSASSTVSGAGFSTYLAAPPVIGGTTPSSANFTTVNSTSTNDSASAVSGAIVTSGGVGVAKNLFVGGGINPSQTNGIIGTTTTNNANAGSVGEYIESVISASTPITTTAVSQNFTSISLTAGDWDVSGTAEFIGGAGAATYTTVAAGISLTSATQAAAADSAQLVVPFAASSNQFLAIPTKRISVSSTTTVFLVGLSVWSAGSMNYQCRLRARRIR